VARHRGQKWGSRDLGMPGLKTWEREALKRIAAKRGQVYVDSLLMKRNPETAKEYATRVARRLIRDLGEFDAIRHCRNRYAEAVDATQRNLWYLALNEVAGNPQRNPWTHGTLGLGSQRAAAGETQRLARQDAERDRYNYIRDAIEVAKAGGSLREITALSHAAARIRPLTKDEALRIVKARGVCQRRNPVPEHVAACKRCDGTGRVYLPGERRKIGKLYVKHPSSWRSAPCPKCQYIPGKKNPPRDPIFVGAFADEGPKISSRYADGDTAAVASLYKKGTWEVWIFGMIDPALGDSWNLAEKNLSRGAAVQRAHELAR
jgi:hypothetical protein